MKTKGEQQINIYNHLEDNTQNNSGEIQMLRNRIKDLEITVEINKEIIKDLISHPVERDLPKKVLSSFNRENEVLHSQLKTVIKERDISLSKLLHTNKMLVGVQKMNIEYRNQLSKITLKFQDELKAYEETLKELIKSLDDCSNISEIKEYIILRLNRNLRNSITSHTETACLNIIEVDSSITKSEDLRKEFQYPTLTIKEDDNISTSSSQSNKHNSLAENTILELQPDQIVKGKCDLEKDKVTEVKKANIEEYSFEAISTISEETIKGLLGD